MGCICIPSTVAGLAGPMLSEAWMSSNYRRTVQGCAPHSLQEISQYPGDPGTRMSSPDGVARWRDTRGLKYSTRDVVVRSVRDGR